MKKLILILALGFASVTASAATVLLSGANFDVEYDSALTGLFGTPSISNNSIYFTPTNFKAESLNGFGVVTANSTVNLKIIPKNGFVLGNLFLQERGDYVLRGANSYVEVTGQTRAFLTTNPFNELSNAITSLAPMLVRNGLQNNWSASSFINLSGLNPVGNESVNYTIENLLEAYTEASDIGPKRAFIEKKFSGFSVQVSPVPEPSAVLTLLVGLAGIGLVISRKKVRS